jgi:3-deoxy-D-manno-octulosonic-acid transferase
VHRFHYATLNHLDKRGREFNHKNGWTPLALPSFIRIAEAGRVVKINFIAAASNLPDDVCIIPAAGCRRFQPQSFNPQPYCIGVINIAKGKIDLPTNLLHKTAFGFYNFSWSVALPWLRMNRRLADGYQQRALKDKQPGTADLWIQAASVGESFLALEILKALRVRQPIHILLTTNTRQGIDILDQARSQSNNDPNRIQTTTRFFPFDKPSIMTAAVAAVRPKLMVLLETEIWPGLLRALKKQHCKTIIVNGRITAKSLQRYHLWPSIWRSLRPDKVLAISQADAERFGRLFGPNGIEIMANIKFDRVASTRPVNGHSSGVNSLMPAGVPLVVFASVRHEEENEVKKLVHEIASSRQQVVIGLFPRHIQRVKFWQEALTQIGRRWVLRSAISSPVSTGTVILWDTFGELMPAYRLAQSAFVGGSLAPLGGQNFLEALMSGVVPIVGPSWDNFAWVGQAIVDAGLLKVAADWRQAAALIQQDLDAPQSRAEVIKRGQKFLARCRGGTAQACRQIEALLFER